MVSHIAVAVAKADKDSETLLASPVTGPKKSRALAADLESAGAVAELVPLLGYHGDNGRAPSSNSSDDELAVPAAVRAVPSGERISRTPCPRLGTPDDVASAVCHLAGDEVGAFVNGHNLMVDGGWMAY